MGPDDVGGVHIKYLHHCHRQLWLYARGIRPEAAHARVQLGEAVHDTTFPRHHSFDLGAFRPDHVDIHGWVHETKSSRRPIPADQAQAMHYCYRLDELGVDVAGAIIHYPATRRTLTVEYDHDAQHRARRDITHALSIMQQETSSHRLEFDHCHGCSYTDYCWSQ